MSESTEDSLPTAMVRSLQIVIGVLILGVVTLAVIAAIIRSQGPPANVPPVPMVSYIAVGFAVVMVINRFVLIPAIAKSGRKKLLAAPIVTTKQLMEQYMSRTIVGAALLEGSAFFPADRVHHRGAVVDARWAVW